MGGIASFFKGYECPKRQCYAFPERQPDLNRAYSSGMLNASSTSLKRNLPNFLSLQDSVDPYGNYSHNAQFGNHARGYEGNDALGGNDSANPSGLFIPSPMQTAEGGGGSRAQRHLASPLSVSTGSSLNELDHYGYNMYHKHHAPQHRRTTVQGGSGGPPHFSGSTSPRYASPAVSHSDVLPSVTNTKNTPIHMPSSAAATAGDAGMIARNEEVSGGTALRMGMNDVQRESAPPRRHHSHHSHHKGRPKSQENDGEWMYRLDELAQQYQEEPEKDVK